MTRGIASKTGNQKAVKKTTAIKPVNKSKSIKPVDSDKKKSANKKSTKTVKATKAVKTDNNSKGVKKSNVEKKTTKKKIISKKQIVNKVDTEVSLTEEDLKISDYLDKDLQLSVAEPRIYLDEPVKTSFIDNLSERNKTLLMWIAVIFCMTLVIIFWIINLDNIIQKSTPAAKSNQDLIELKQDFGNLIDKVNQGVSDLNDLSSDANKVIPDVISGDNKTNLDNNLIKEISR